MTFDSSSPILVPKAITVDFVLSQLRIALVATLAYGGGKGWFTPTDAGFYYAIATALGPIAVPWAWSIVANLGKVFVRSDSAAAAVAQVEVHSPMTAKAAATDLVAKIASVILLSFCLLSLSGEARAQGQGLPHLTGNIKRDFAPAAPAGSVTATGNGPIDSALGRFNEGVSKIEKKVVDLVIADLNAAIKDATAHNDLISLPCWQAHLLLFNSLPSQWPEPPSLPMGIALSIQVQRDLLNSITGAEATSLKVACAALYGDQLKIIANVGAMLGIRIATGGLL
jgi:hypothetical protein